MCSPMDASMEEIPLEDEDSESIEFRVLLEFARRNLSASRYQEFLKQISPITGNGNTHGTVPWKNGYTGDNTAQDASLQVHTAISDDKKCKTKKKKKAKWKPLIPSCIRGRKEMEDDISKASAKQRSKKKFSKEKSPMVTGYAAEYPSTLPEEDDSPAKLQNIADRLVEILHDRTDTVENHVEKRTLRQSFSIETDGGIDEDQIIQGIVALLRESGDRLNEKIQADKSMSQSITKVFASYNSFKKLADQYLEEVVPETETEQQSVKVAVAMDITTRLTAIDNHPMNKVLGFGVKYLKENFSPWIQNQGGWEKALGVTDQEEVE